MRDDLTWWKDSSHLASICSVAGDVQTLTSIGATSARIDAQHGSFFVKWLPADDSLAQNELLVNRTILSRSSLRTPRLIHVITAPNGALGLWEWLEGHDLRRQRRDLLADVFARLGAFHVEQRYSGQIVSPVTHYSYPSAREMLEAELPLLATGGSDRLREACVPHFDLLAQASFPTWIHGDVHPGNVLLTARGPYLVDWAFALPSLNLLDLDYVESLSTVPLNEEEWWRIGPAEAGAVLKAYFAACESGGNSVSVHRAVMVWALLRSHYNAAQQEGHNHSSACYAAVWELVSA